MKSIRLSIPEDYKLFNGFQSICKTLLEKKYSDRWEKSLAYWVLPDDRRVPMALLGHNVGELLSTSFDDLFDTPGVGRKKIETLVMLLKRVAKEAPSALGTDSAATTDASVAKSNGKSRQDGKFDSAKVSEAVWVRWRRTVRRHGLGREKIGYLAASLQALPTVIWHRPLDFYLERNLDEIRALKTHGEKRVRAVLAVFGALHRMLAKAGTDSHLKLHPVPIFVVSVENWITEAAIDDVPPNAKAVRRHLVLPLLEQLLIDGGEILHQLVGRRLGVDGKSHSVSTQSRRMGVTRARVYQLLEECGNIMSVRWPQGHYHLAQLAEKITNKDALEMLNELRELLYPES